MNLISNSQIYELTGIFGNHFDTFSLGRTRLITVYKEVKETLNINSPNPMYGYGMPSAIQNYTFTVNSGIFPAVIRYDLEQKQDQLIDAKNKIDQGEVKIKVEQAARDFIKDGMTITNIQFDGKTYNKITDEGVQSYLGLKYYFYTLQATL